MNSNINQPRILILNNIRDVDNFIFKQKTTFLDTDAEAIQFRKQCETLAAKQQQVQQNLKELGGASSINENSNNFQRVGQNSNTVSNQVNQRNFNAGPAPNRLNSNNVPTNSNNFGINNNSDNNSSNLQFHNVNNFANIKSTLSGNQLPNRNQFTGPAVPSVQRPGMIQQHNNLNSNQISHIQKKNEHQNFNQSTLKILEKVQGTQIQQISRPENQDQEDDLDQILQLIAQNDQKDAEEEQQKKKNREQQISIANHRIGTGRFDNLRTNNQFHFENINNNNTQNNNFNMNKNQNMNLLSTPSSNYLNHNVINNNNHNSNNGLINPHFNNNVMMNKAPNSIYDKFNSNDGVHKDMTIMQKDTQNNIISNQETVVMNQMISTDYTARMQSNLNGNPNHATLNGGGVNNRKMDQVTGLAINTSVKNYQFANAAEWNTKKFPWDQAVMDLLKLNFGYESFRNNQKAIINCILAKNDAFIVMPTGGGKSLTFQIPALVEKGVSIIVMPLISLIHDQVGQLPGYTVSVTGNSIYEDLKSCFDDCLKQDFTTQQRLFYVTPEKIGCSGYFWNFLQRLYKKNRLSLFVIDEAHCVSHWGRDFRENYTKLGVLQHNFPNVPMIALTATATEKVKIDTVNLLEMNNPLYFQCSFNRPNLMYEVRDQVAKNFIKDIHDFIREKYRRKSGIIYCLQKSTCEQVVQQINDLNDPDLTAGFYHAQMPVEEQSKIQDQWMMDEIQVIVGTIAFGMGINKPDVRYVIHHTCSKSIENYYQESGRAGRDGKQSHCIIYYNGGDRISLSQMIQLNDKSEQCMKEETKSHLDHMIKYCEDKLICRREYQLNYLSEKFDRQKCNKMCDNCIQDHKFVDFPCTEIVATILNMMLKFTLSNRRILITLNQLKNAVREAAATKNDNLKNSEVWGLCQDMPKERSDNLINEIRFRGYLYEQLEKKGEHDSSFLFLNKNMYENFKQNPQFIIRFPDYEPKSNRRKGGKEQEADSNNQEFQMYPEDILDQARPPNTRKPKIKKANDDAQLEDDINNLYQFDPTTASKNNATQDSNITEREKVSQKKDVFVNPASLLNNKFLKINELDQFVCKNQKSTQIATPIQGNIKQEPDLNKPQNSLDQYSFENQLLNKLPNSSSSFPSLTSTNSIESIDTTSIPYEQLEEYALKIGKQLISKDYGFCKNEQTFEQLVQRLQLIRKQIFNINKGKEEIYKNMHIDTFFPLSIINTICKNLPQNVNEVFDSIKNINLIKIMKSNEKETEAIVREIKHFMEGEQIDKSQYLIVDFVNRDEEIFEIQDHYIEQQSTPPENPNTTDFNMDDQPFEEDSQYSNILEMIEGLENDNQQEQEGDFSLKRPIQQIEPEFDKQTKLNERKIKF